MRAVVDTLNNHFGRRIKDISSVISNYYYK